jgi:hypothetical protein
VHRSSAAMRAGDGIFRNGYLAVPSAGLADSLPVVDPAGGTVVHRSSTAMKASDQRHVFPSSVWELVFVYVYNIIY